MHEYAVTKGLVKTVTDEAVRAGASKVLEVRLVIGDLSSIMDESVQMYFDIMAQGTIAQGAKLSFKRIPAEFLCRDCGHTFEKPVKGFDCPKCGGMGMQTGKGKEFYIESLEVE